MAQPAINDASPFEDSDSDGIPSIQDSATNDAPPGADSATNDGPPVDDSDITKVTPADCSVKSDDAPLVEDSTINVPSVDNSVNNDISPGDGSAMNYHSPVEDSAINGAPSLELLFTNVAPPVEGSATCDASPPEPLLGRHWRCSVDIPAEKVSYLLKFKEKFKEHGVLLSTLKLSIKFLTLKGNDNERRLQTVQLHGKYKDVHLVERQIQAWLKGYLAVFVEKHAVDYFVSKASGTVDEEYNGDQRTFKLVWLKSKGTLWIGPRYFIARTVCNEVQQTQSSVDLKEQTLLDKQNCSRHLHEEQDLTDDLQVQEQRNQMAHSEERDQCPGHHQGATNKDTADNQGPVSKKYHVCGDDCQACNDDPVDEGPGTNNVPPADAQATDNNIPSADSSATNNTPPVEDSNTNDAQHVEDSTTIDAQHVEDSTINDATPVEDSVTSDASLVEDSAINDLSPVSDSATNDASYDDISATNDALPADSSATNDIPTGDVATTQDKDNDCVGTELKCDSYQATNSDAASMYAIHDHTSDRRADDPSNDDRPASDKIPGSNKLQTGCNEDQKMEQNMNSIQSVAENINAVDTVGNVSCTKTMHISVDKVESLRQRFDAKCDLLDVRLTVSKEYDSKTRLQK